MPAPVPVAPRCALVSGLHRFGNISRIGAAASRRSSSSAWKIAAGAKAATRERTMNNGRDPRAIGLALAALAALFAATAAQAQEVHKCNVNGAVTYQST